MFRYLPEQGSDFAPAVDRLNYLITDISVFFTVAIVGTMIFFAIKYRRRNGVDHETPQIEGSKFLEVLWTVIPSLVCIFVAGYGYAVFDRMRKAPEDALEINVKGRQWNWTFTYSNGKELTNEFYVPVGKPVKLILTSNDVLHSFFVPGMRTKMDAIPGRYTYQWFRPVVTGEQQVFCTEYCGTLHSQMLAKMHVVSEDEYARWIADRGRKEEVTPAKIGQALYTKHACSSCHSLDGSAVVGPSFLKLYGRKAKFDTGEDYEATDDYLRESILNSQTHIVQGYPKPSPMPVFEGILSNDDVGNLIAFIKSLNKAPAAVAKQNTVDISKLSPPDRGKQLYTTKLCIGCHSLDGSKVVGPTFKGLYGRDGEFDDGGKYKADDAYLKESILNSQAHIVKGYPKPSPMPNYVGQLSDQEISDIIEFIKTTK